MSADERISRKVDITLANISKLGLVESDLEKALNLTRGWFSATKAGKNRVPRATANWAKIDAYIQSLEAGPAMPPPPRSKYAPAVDTGWYSAAPAAKGSDGADMERFAEAISKANTAKALGNLMRDIGSMVARGRMELRMADTLEKCVARQAKLLHEAREEKAVAQIRALEILTDEETNLLRDYREKLAGPPLGPGDAVPPPDEIKAAED